MNDIPTDRGWRNLIKRNKFPVVNIKSAENIWKNNSDRTFKLDNIFADYLNVPIYLSNGKYCFGIIRINSIIKNNNEYIYNFDVLTRFEDPKPIIMDEKTEGEIIEDIKFLSESDEYEEEGLHPFWIYKKVKRKDKIENLEDVEIMNKIALYDVSKLSDKKLYDDYKIINSWYAVSKLNKNKIPLNTIIYLAKKIYREVDKRKLLYKTNENKKELFELVNKNSIKLTDLKNL